LKVSSPNRKPGIHVAWTTVTYRSVALMVLAGGVVLLLGMRFTFPQFTENSIKAADGVANRILERVAGMAPPTGGGTSTAQQAHLRSLDGAMWVKKGRRESWLAAA